MKVRTIEDLKGFESLKTDWERLSKTLITENGYEWNYKWWRHLGKGKNLKLVVFEHNNKFIGIAPMFVEQIRTFRFFTLNKLSIMGGDVTDYKDVLIDGSFDKESVLLALMEYVQQEIRPDLIEFGQVNTGYLNFDIWEKYFEKEVYEPLLTKECHGVDLSKFENYDDYYKQLSKGLKKDFRNKKNKIKNDGILIEFEIKTEINNKDIESIAQVNIERQKFLRQKGFDKRDSLYADKNKTQFIKDFFCNGEAETRRLAYLRFNKDIIAYVLYFEEKESIHLWNAAFDPRYEIYSPSKLLYNELIKYSFDNNYKYFDFMRGNEPYKLHWTNNFTINHYLIKKCSLKSKILYGMKNLTPEFLLKRMRKSDIKLIQIEEA